jgi:hypothetical protein
MRAAADFVPDGVALKAAEYLVARNRTEIGPFAITPHLVDHSGFDAYALEIEADGRRLFYSGDLRAHGRKSKLFESMVNNPPKKIDTMLMEKDRVSAVWPTINRSRRKSVGGRFRSPLSGHVGDGAGCLLCPEYRPCCHGLPRGKEVRSNVDCRCVCCGSLESDRA